MTVLQKYVEKKRSNGEKLLSIYLTAGFPNLEATLPLMVSLVEAGADMIELGVPFSDPLADGPTIQAASQVALDAGATLPSILKILTEFRKQHSIPALLMGYANPFWQFGWDKLIRQSKTAGVNGFIIPDFPPEESLEIRQKLHGAGMNLIYLVSPNTTEKRIKLINELSSGFVYAVSVIGTTGVREKLPAETGQYLRRLRRQIDHPLLVGFGVSSPQSAQELALLSDGVIIGSAVINRIAESADVDNACRRVYEFVKGIKI